MDRTAQELNKASHILLDAEIRLNTVAIQVKDLDRQIALLNSVEAHLEENIGILQRKRVIVMVSEFKKAKIDLQTCRARRSFLRVDRENCLKMQNHCKTSYEKARADYERIFNLIHNPPNNVIEIDFGRKK